MKIGIVNHMPAAVATLQRILASDDKHEVAWVATNGAEAVERCLQQRPDLILMDLEMPVMDGVTATRQIMSQQPCGILLVAANVHSSSARVFEALGAGALDAVHVPSFDGETPPWAGTLLAKINMLGVLIRDLRNEAMHFRPVSTPAPAPFPCHKLVAIGASVGGPFALAQVLANLPKHFPAGVVIVQHLDEQFAPGMADWLNQQSAVPVRVAQEGDAPANGVALIAATNDHLVFTGPQRLGYSVEPRSSIYRPSIDVFFESMARHWRGEAAAVLLTGMGRDGASGLKLLRDQGVHTIAQDKDSSAVYGMPKAAAQLEAAVEILPLNRIAAGLARRFLPDSKPPTT